jgi:hypothetical protein
MQCGASFGNYMPHNAYKLFATYEQMKCLVNDAKVLHMKQLEPERKSQKKKKKKKKKISLNFFFLVKIASVLLDGDASNQLNHTLFRFAVHFMPDDGTVTPQQFADLLEKRIQAFSPVGIEISSVEAGPTTRANHFVFVHIGRHGDEHALRVAHFLARMPDVNYIEPMGETMFHLSAAKSEQWNGQPSSALPVGLDGTGQRLGIADQGVDACGGTVQLINPGISDPHGTAMAVVAASTNGIASKAAVYHVAVQRSAFTGVSDKVQVMMSQDRTFVLVSGAGAAATSYNAAAREIDQLARDNGLLLPIFAAGNDPSQLTSTAYSKNALVVGAVGTRDNKFVIGATSPRQGTADRRNKPDLVAPGEGLNLGAACAVDQNSGTSLAAAAAAGAALLARQYYVDGWYPVGEVTPEAKSLGFSPSGALLKATLIHAAMPVSAARDTSNGISGAGRVPSAVQGYGRIQLDRALFVKGQSDFSGMSVSDTQELENGATFQICINVAAPKPLRATLAWMDVPADPSAGHTLVNDLDLAIYSIDTGRVWRGNGLAGFDHANTVEQVSLSRAGARQVQDHRARRQARREAEASASSPPAATARSRASTAARQGSGGQPYGACPNGCTSYLNDCTNGVCVCNSADGVGVGFDCSLAHVHQTDCGLFGECDYAVGACRCVEKKRGPGCALAFDNHAARGGVRDALDHRVRRLRGRAVRRPRHLLVLPRLHLRRHHRRRRRHALPRVEARPRHASVKSISDMQDNSHTHTHKKTVFSVLFKDALHEPRDAVLHAGAGERGARLHAAEFADVGDVRRRRAPECGIDARL